MGYMQIFLHFSWITAYIWQFEAVLLQKNAEKNDFLCKKI